MLKIDNVPGLLLLFILTALFLLFLVYIVRSLREISRRKTNRVPSEQASSILAGAFERPLADKLESPQVETIFVHADLTVPLTVQQHQAWQRLPPRQREAAILIAFGKSTSEAAASMSIQQSTLRGYLKEVYAALHLRSRTELANFVRDIALLDATPPQDSDPLN